MTDRLENTGPQWFRNRDTRVAAVKEFPPNSKKSSLYWGGEMEEEGEEEDEG